MINNSRMTFIKSQNGINYYLFKPSLFSLYYNDKKAKHKEEPPHRYSLSHKLHMLYYLVTTREKYRILYLEQDGKILSYIVFIKANNKIVANCDIDDYYVIFLWTYPEYRGKGLATAMAKSMLHDLSLNFNRFYKNIHKNNFSSIRVAEKCGFRIECCSAKSRWLHTIQRVDNGENYLYYFHSAD